MVQGFITFIMALWLSVILVGCGGRTSSGQPAPSPAGVVVTVRVADAEEYRIRLTDPDDIGIARKLLAGDDAPLIPSSVSAPTLLLIGGADQGIPNLLEEGLALASDAAVLSLPGLVAPEQRYQYCHPDMCDVRRQAHLLADFVILAAQVYGFNPGCIVVVGDVSGATLGVSVLLVRQELLAGAILLHHACHRCLRGHHFSRVSQS